MNTLTILGQSFEGIIFDVDGTLVDSNEAHALAWKSALKESSIDISYPKLRSLIGMGGDKLLPAATGIYTDSSGGKILEASRGKIFKKKFLPLLHAFPGVNDTLAELARRGLKLGIATSASRKDLDGLLKQARIRTEVFGDNLVCSDDAEASKPDPDILLAAQKRIQLPSSRLLMVGDTPYDVEAANRSGMKAVAVRCGGFWSDDDFRAPLAIYDTINELLAGSAS